MAVKIYCPKCEYHPKSSDRWMCHPGCWTIWNTFDTRALCPGCKKQWLETICPACHRWSLHEDWYHEDLPDQKEHEHEEEPVLVGAD